MLNQPGRKPSPERPFVAIFETVAAREQVIRFCEEVRVLIVPAANWYSFNQLNEPRAAREAMEKACAADLIIFSAAPNGDFSPEMKGWIESWVINRCEREGAMVGLLPREPGFISTATLKEIYLRHVAHQAGMDYLTHARPTRARAMPDSIDSYTQRAGQITTILDKILQEQPRTTLPW